MLVGDTLKTLQDFAREYRKLTGARVIAITGTNGKTTTKELLARVLASRFRVHSTHGNLNNHIGVPLTLLNAPVDTEVMVIEMGANHIGEIELLSNIALPDYGIITNIGKAHLEGFGSFEGVIRAKSELYRHISSSGGQVIYNSENPLLSSLVDSIKPPSIRYDKAEGGLNLKEIRSTYPLKLIYESTRGLIDIESSLFGQHNIENITAAVAVGLIFGLDANDIMKAVNGYRPDNNRSELRETSSNTLVCDAYNANPDSMKRAITAFLEVNKDPKSVILGDMLELGETAVEEHKQILKLLESAGRLDVYLVGELFGKASEGMPGRYNIFDSTQMLISYLEKNPITNNFVLLKGSRAMQLESVYSYL